MARPSPYERQAWEQIQDWRVARGVPWPGVTPGSPPPRLSPVAPVTVTAADGLLGRIVDTILPSLVSAMNDVAQWRVERLTRRPENDPHAGTPTRDLDLEVIDRAVESIRTRYVSAMGAQGAGAGALGAPGIIIDLPVLVLCNLRAVGEYGARYGFDLTLLHERLWAGQVLAFSAGASQAARAAAMLNLRQIATAVASGATWAELDQIVVVQVLREIAAILGLRLTRKRLGRLVPVLGALVGGAANVQFTAGTCEAAYYLYRERFLMRKHGEAITGRVIDTLPEGGVLLRPLPISNGDGADG